MWCHTSINIWGVQSFLYVDFSNAVIDMKNGKINNITIHYSKHHNNGDGGGNWTARTQADSVITSLDFDPEKTDQQIIYNYYDVITEQEFIAYTTPQTRELSQTQIKKRRIAELKRNLQNTDYQAIKYAEGELSAEDYASTKAQRQSWRAEINQLESELQL